MKILFLTSGPQVPSSRFRIQPYLRRFRAEGHKCVLANSFPAKYDYFPWMGFRPSQILKRSVRWWHWLRARLSSFDIVYIEREIFDDPTTDVEERFKACCRKLVIDFDDAVFLRYPDKFNRLVKMSDLVVCGNRFLVEKAAPLNNSIVHVPTCVDLDEYSVRSFDSDNAEPVVGWIGTTGNLKYIEVVAEALRMTAREIDFEFRVVVPDISPLNSIDLRGVRVVHHPWNAKSQVRQLQAFDVGLMPLFPDEEWAIYKCGAKLIQYLAVGVTGIASPVGVNVEILDENRSGFLAKDTADWHRALTVLLQDAELRRDMGERGRKTIAEKYSIQANYPVLRNALGQLMLP